MNETNFEHAIYAVLLQIAVGVLTGNWWIGAAAGVFFFLGREDEQPTELREPPPLDPNAVVVTLWPTA